MTILDQMEQFRDAITDTGTRCVLDGRDVNPPAVLIRPATLTYRFGRGCYRATWAAWLYLPDAGQLDAIRIGLPILETVQTALATVGVAVLTAAPADFTTPDGATVPGFILNWETTQ